ncbi:MAG: hypothetical protein V7761_10800 [Amylibacter sp.]
MRSELPERSLREKKHIDADQLRYLIERVTVLRDVTDRVCQDYIAALAPD